MIIQEFYKKIKAIKQLYRTNFEQKIGELKFSYS